MNATANQHRKARGAGWAGALAVAAAFILSRIVLYLLGVRFIHSPIGFAMQYLDPELLQHDLLRSLLYLHSQPPLFNLLLGAVLKAFPDPATAFMLLFQAAGLAASLCLYGLLRAVGLPAAAAAAASVLYLLNPTVILYENLLYYTYMESVLVLAAAYCLFAWGRTLRARWAAGFWLVLGALGGMRSVFHPVFFVGLAAFLGLFILKKYPRRKHAALLCAASLLAIAPLGLVMVKNHALYGFWGTSSWDGMNLWTKTSGYGPGDLEKLHRGGVISSLAVDAELEPFRALDQYAAGQQLLETPCHHPADCTAYKSTGKPNFNHAGYVHVSRQLKKDALSLAAHDPARFAFQTLASYCLTLWHASDSVHGLFHDNMEILEPLEAAYRWAHFGFLGVKSRYGDEGVWLRTALVSLLYLLAYAGALWQACRARGGAAAASLACLFCLLVHAYTLAVSSVVEFGENNRFRFGVDGAFLVLLAGSAAAVFGRLRRRVSGQGAKT